MKHICNAIDFRFIFSLPMTFIVLIIAKSLLSYKLATKKEKYILDFGYLFPAFYGFDQLDAALRI